MTEPTEADLSTLQAEVQRGLGRCLLNLQLCELVLKTLLAGSGIIAAPAAEGGFSASAQVNAERMTLGGLVSQMFGTVLFPPGGAFPPDDGPETETPGPSAHVRFRIELPPETLAEVGKGLRDLVAIRNALVHHFVERHDLASVEGCRAAILALASDRARIVDHLREMTAWARDMDLARRELTDLLRADDIAVILTGEAMAWRHTGIVQGLQEAERALSKDGWTSLASARAWVSARYPGECPSHYECRSWPHLLHEAGLFELRRPSRSESSVLYRTRSNRAAGAF